MFLRFFDALRSAGVPVSLREHLAFLDALGRGLGAADIDGLHALARTCLVKDERFFDRFDRAFGEVFRGVERLEDALSSADIPPEWLARGLGRSLSQAERDAIEAMGGLDKLMETLKHRLEEQKGRHEGGNKWIGTGGTSPFGAYGYNPEGIRIGQDGNRNFRAVKVWDKREFKDLDDTAEIGTRAIKIALRRLRRFARSGAPDELDLDATVEGTARQGWLDVHMRPERRNGAKVLLLLDVGGSMDWHVRVCEELFSAARVEFRRLEHFYFHNCVYEHLWKDNRRRRAELTPTFDVLRGLSPDWRVVIVGDASMSPYEIMVPGGSVEHMNEEAGQVWITRLVDRFPKLAWINPLPEAQWDWTASVGMVRDLVGGRMHPLTLEGLEAAMRQLAR
ncbi:vWA domain-containing protein [Chenggangzhangella methanolivorans]|uniref:VWA domain-containing protein n=1 Tax=Chenggangzhangella methanolivorans TaxID=1437009 RepID=A0A9E6R8K6_9HYPH|nr:VWA domain-containing protein [Chenggangzhangella methanolivorans]QZN99486.1 VWA domain-containing protein [Chenggangzhangella methanolivorans]